MLNYVDQIICADGGIRHSIKLSRIPNIVIGDFDSTSIEEKKYIDENNIPTKKFKKDKNNSDLALAVDFAIDAGATNIIIFGALGNRWDHSVGNLLLPQQNKYSGIDFEYWENGEHFYFIHDVLTLNIEPKTNISLFPLSNCENISTNGLIYPLINENLPLGTTRGLSNIATQNNIRISIGDGLLLCIIGSTDHI